MSKSKSSRKNKEKNRKKLIKYVKKCLIIYLILIVPGTAATTILNSSTSETNYPKPTSNFYIEDYSKVYTEDTEQYIMQESVALCEATKAQICVVSVPDTQEDSLEDYSYTLANKWGIGDAKLDNGILLLFTTDGDDPHVRMEVGSGLEGCLPDSKAGRILDDYAVDDKNNGNWNKAAINTFVATALEIYNEYGITAPSSLSYVASPIEKVTGTTMADDTLPEVIVTKNESPLAIQIFVGFFVFIILSIIPYIILVFILYSNTSGSTSGSRWYNSGGGSGGFGGGGGFSGGGGGFSGGGASR